MNWDYTSPPVRSPESALYFAKQFVAINNRTHGAPPARVWQRPGTTTRIYFAGKAPRYFKVDYSGQLQPEWGDMRGYVASSFYPSQARAIRSAADEYEQWRDEEIARQYASAPR